MTFDELRAAYPDLAISLYALEPGGPVTLELITPEGQSFSFPAATAAAAIETAFPGAVEPEPPSCPNTGLPCVPNCDRKTCAGLRVPLNEWPTPEQPNAFD